MRSIATKEDLETFVVIKKQIQEAQIKAALSANKELIKLYWSIGKNINEKQSVNDWGWGS